MKGKSLLFGLLSGAIFGVLFAPKSGKKIREELKKEREKGGTGLDTLKASFLEMGSDVLESIDQMTPEDEEKKKAPKKK